VSVGGNVVESGDGGQAWLIGVCLVDLQQCLGVLGFEGVLVATAFKQLLAVDEQNLFLVVLLLVLA
jgi:hypothetical protein